MQAYSSVSDCPTTIGPPIGLTFEAVRGLLKRNPCQLPAKLLKRSCLVFIPGSFSLLKGNPPIWMESSFNCCQRLFGFWETPQLNCLLLCLCTLWFILIAYASLWISERILMCFDCISCLGFGVTCQFSVCVCLCDL